LRKNATTIMAADGQNVMHFVLWGFPKEQPSPICAIVIAFFKNINNICGDQPRVGSFGVAGRTMRT